MYFVIHQHNKDAKAIRYRSAEEIMEDYPPDEFEYIETWDMPPSYWGEDKILVIEGKIMTTKAVEVEIKHEMIEAKEEN